MSALLKTQKNDVFREIEFASLNPADFSWEEERNVPTLDRIRFRGSDFTFQLIVSRGGWDIVFSPAEERPSAQTAEVNWPGALLLVGRWLTYLKRETEAPDLWARMEPYRFLQQGILRERFSNEPLSYEHVERVHAAVAGIRDQIAGEFQLTHEALADVNRRLDYLDEAAKRLGRFDWVNVAVSTFLNIAVAASMTPERAKALWDTFWGMLKGWLQLPG